MSLGGLGSIKRLEEDGRGIKRIMRVGREEEKVVNSPGFFDRLELLAVVYRSGECGCLGIKTGWFMSRFFVSGLMWRAARLTVV